MSAIRKQNLHFYEFGPFRLDAQERLLFKGSEMVYLTPKVVETLLALVEHRGRLIPKDELMRLVWPDSFVEESNLAQNISLLRKALGEHSGGHYIETLPKRGYRFTAEVKEVRQEPAAFLLHPVENSRIALEGQELLESAATPRLVERQSTKTRLATPGGLAVLTFGVIAIVAVAYLIQTWLRGPALSTPRSMAVLPFKTLDAESESAGLGMADAVILRLAHQNQLLVLPTSSIFKYTERDVDARSIGRELGVDAVLDGTIQRSGDRLRVTAQLIRTSDGSTLWTGKFDQQVTDIFVVQDLVSAQLADALPLTGANHDKKLNKHYTQNPEAYELYTVGLYFWNKRTEEGLTKAVEYFKQAIEKDPNFALAHASLSDSYMLFGHYEYGGMTRRQMLPRVRESALRAIELDPNLAEAQSAMAVVNALEGNYPEAIRLYERAIELNPNQGTAHLRYGYLLATLGRLDEAIHHMERAHALDPLSSTVDVNLSAYYGFKRDYDAAIKFARMALDINPEVWEARVNLGEVLEAKGLYQEAEAEYKKMEQAGRALEAKQQLAYVYAVTGRTDDAWRLLAELEQAHVSGKGSSTTAHNIALVYVGLGKHDEAFEWLNKAFESRALVRTDFDYGHKLDPLRTDPRFSALREKIQERLRQRQEARARAGRPNFK